MNETSNQYDPPLCAPDDAVISSELTRESLVDLIRSFLSSEITSWDFDDRLDAFRDAGDPIIRYIVDSPSSRSNRVGVRIS